MSNKSQINKLSKREIFENLYYEQQQSTTMLNRLIIALAAKSGVSPEDLATTFNDSQKVADYADKFNTELRKLSENPKTEPSA